MIAQATATGALTLKVGSCSLPHPEKLDTGGEDAFFVSSNESALGVAGTILTIPQAQRDLGALEAKEL
jgi:hypothetical protein